VKPGEVVTGNDWLVARWQSNGVLTVSIEVLVLRTGAPLALLVTRCTGLYEATHVNVVGSDGARWTGKFTPEEAAQIEALLEVATTPRQVPS
jgi:hypothetical protein